MASEAYVVAITPHEPNACHFDCRVSSGTPTRFRRKLRRFSGMIRYQEVKTLQSPSERPPPFRKIKILAAQCAFCNLRNRRLDNLKIAAGIQRNAINYTSVLIATRPFTGVRSNMLRHNLIHGFPRTGHVRPIAEYRVQFAPPQTGSLVHSDTTMQPQVVWDEDGPFSKRQAHSPGSLKARRRYN
ncbi:hypothetical protein B0H17DRAFT_1133685 [Mycena rosella]|uniref:Uncharacterized protein n=1 Tax=Mycena rosella TaxID=1033263 RepID=A0AAD7GF61_MYCRO|nr:hypothetical protein B0H17DRAFT_1133685 [Mycena rosella]